MKKSFTSKEGSAVFHRIAKWPAGSNGIAPLRLMNWAWEIAGNGKKRADGSTTEGMELRDL